MDFEDDIYTKIKNGEYENNWLYPSKDDYTQFNAYKNGEVKMNIDADEVALYKSNGYLVESVFNKESFVKYQHEYRVHNSDLNLKFREDLFKEYRVSDNPKREKAFDMAWDRGHSGGYTEVVNYFDELVELIK